MAAAHDAVRVQAVATTDSELATVMAVCIPVVIVMPAQVLEMAVLELTATAQRLAVIIMTRNAAAHDGAGARASDGTDDAAHDGAAKD